MLAASLSASAFPPADPAVAVDAAPRAVASSTLGSRLRLAAELYDKGNYRATVDELRAVATASELPLPPEEMQDFLFLLGSACFKADLPEGCEILEEYITRYPASKDATDARLITADFHFFAHEWSDALEIYKAIDLTVLDADSRDLYTFREALCMIKCGFYEEALPLLDSISKSGDCALQARFYKAYIYYVEGADSKALDLFSELNRVISPADRRQGMDPDYYIAQIYFRKGEWKKAASMTASLLEADTAPELALPTLRILGMSRYEMKDYSRARKDLQKYVDQAGDDASHDALYALGVCLYDNSDLQKARACFERIVADTDAIGQGASLYLGQIFAAEHDPSAAAINFERAYRMNYDNRVAEKALYNYVAARAGGGNIPFDSNVGMLEEFIRNYPDSEYAPVIERHLSTLYFNNGDYDNALRVAERIRRPSDDDNRRLQSILYAGGTSQLSAGNPAKASRLLRRCVDISGADQGVRTQAMIWLGDALYDLGEYAEAEKYLAQADRSGRAAENAAHTKYSLGYARLMQNKFRDASTAFSSLLGSSVNLPSDMKRDALLRIADCKYYAGDYAGAKQDFASLRSEGQGADYATYRYAQILGIEGNLSGKINELKRFESIYADSRWLPNALTELADTYVADNRNAEAAAAYGRMLDLYPVDPAAPRARLGMGAALTASGDADGGAEAYREVMRRWPSSEQARIADRELRDYYADRHRLGEYADFLSTIPGFSVDASELDSLAYNVAEREYLDNPSSIAPLKGYLDDYPDGLHSSEAWSMIARHYYDANDSRNALAAYRELEKRGGAEYSTEAYIGIMRTADNSGVRTDYARRLRDSGGAPADAVEEADFYLAEADLHEGNASRRKAAEKKLRELAANPWSEFGARSAVALGEWLLESGRPQEALDFIKEFTESGTGQTYWLARGFIVQADAYTALGQEATAREYLRSLRRNYPGDEPDIPREIDNRLK